MFIKLITPVMVIHSVCFFHSLQESEDDSVNHMLLCVGFSLSFGQLVLSCFAENAQDSEKVRHLMYLIWTFEPEQREPR